jgi:hypothetical protein
MPTLPPPYSGVSCGAGRRNLLALRPWKCWCPGTIALFLSVARGAPPLRLIAQSDLSQLSF